ncbi:MAG: metal ABC transporter solute-binding protein, Zn/Mn family [Candidatus Electrothrix sp. YB6]
MSAAVVCLVLSCSSGFAQGKNCGLKIGASLHPYYSWTKNIVGDAAEVVSLIPSGSDPHAYQPVPSDMQRLEGLDVVIVNGVGHDEFIKPMLKAVENDKMLVIDTSKGLPLIPAFNKHYSFEGQDNKVAYNSHTYIAITGAIQQMQKITRKLARLCPDQAGTFIQNVRAYSAELRNMLQSALMQLDRLNLNNVRIATVHDGYSYLFQELGIEVSAVVQPRHGVRPSARQLQDTIKRIKRANVNILFGELDYEKKYVDIIYQETGCRLYALSHISNGQYTKEFFEQAMQRNIDAIIAALTEVAGGPSAAPGMPGMPGNIPKDMSKKMQGTVQEQLNDSVPEMQQKQMSERMQQQVQDTTKQMQDSVQGQLKESVPEMQQKQMSERMNQQVQDTTKQMRDSVQEQLKDAVPEMQQKQMSERMNQQVQDTTKQMQNSMRETLQKTVPEMQQKQIEGRMKDMQKNVQENLVPKVQEEQAQ